MSRKKYVDRDKAVKQEIRETWFKNHVAKLTQHGDLQVLEWAKPGTICYYVRYVFDGANMYISGDIGHAVFRLTWRASVHSFDNIGTHYFMEKITAYSGDRYDFDGEEAEKYLEDWYKEHIAYIMEEKRFKSREDKKEFVERFNELKCAARDCDNENRWGHEIVNQEFYDFISEELDRDYFEWIYNIGRVTPHRILGYIVGLQMASEQLKKQEGEK